MEHHKKGIHRMHMHGAFAWLMIGMVTGMAMTILYVANQSITSLQTVDAAAQKFIITGPVETGSRMLSTWTYGNAAWISDNLQNSKKIDAAGTYSMPTPSMNTNGQYFQAGSDLVPGQAVGALLFSPKAGKLFVNRGATIDTTTGGLDLTKNYRHTFKAYYIKKGGTKVPVSIVASFLPGTDIDGYGWDAYSRTHTLDGNNSIQVPGGIPYYVSPQLGMRFDNVPESGDQEADRHFKVYSATFPSMPADGTWEIDIAQKVYGQPSSGYRILDKIFIPDPNRSPKLNTIGNQSVMGGKTLMFTVAATDEDNNSLVYMATNMPTGASLTGLGGVFTWTPPIVSAAYDRTITVMVYDGRGGLDKKDIKITVLPTVLPPSETPPVVVIDPSTATVDTKLSIIGNSQPITSAARGQTMSLISFAATQQLTLKKFTLNLQGQAVANGTPAFTISLRDTMTGANFGETIGFETCTPTVKGCSVTFSPNYTFSAGTTKSIQLVINSSNFNNAAGSADALGITMSEGTDALWTDTAGQLHKLSQNVLPLSILTISYE